MINLDPFADKNDAAEKLARQVGKLEEDALAVGAPVEMTEPRESMFGKILNTLSKPNQAVLGLLDAAFLRGDLGQPGVGLGIARGLEERTNAFDLLRRETELGPVARGVAGFGLGLITDPLSYIASPIAASRFLPGGLAATKKGSEVFQQGLKALIDSGDDLFTAQEKLSTAFRGLHEYNKHAQGIRGAVKAAGGATPEVLNLVSEVAGKSGRGVAQMLSDIQPLSAITGATDEASLAKLAGEVFEKPGVFVGANVPFAGHFTGKNAGRFNRALANPNSSLLTKGLSGVADLLAFDKVGTKLDLPESVVGLMDDAATIARTATENVRRSLTGAAEGGSLGAKAILGVDKAIKTTKDMLVKTFAHNRILGPAAKEAEDFVNAEAIINHNAEIRTRDLLKELYNPDGSKNLVTAQKVALDTDALGMGMTLKEWAKKLNGTPEGEKMLELLNKVAAGAPRSSLDWSPVKNVMTQINEEFNKRWDDYLLNPNIDQTTKDLAQKLKTGFGEILEMERAAGLETGDWAHYIPHVFQNASKSKALAGASKARMERFYSTIGEAFEDAGLIANLDITELYKDRLAQSLRAIGKQKFGQRALMLNSMPEEVYRKLVLEYVSGGPTAKAAGAVLMKEGLPLPTAIGDVAPGAMSIAEREARVGMLQSEGIIPPSSPRVTAYDEIVNSPEVKALGSEKAKEAVTKAVLSSREAFNDMLRLKGFQTFSDGLPKGVAGETARVVTEGIGKTQRSYVVPAPIYDAIEETKLQRDVVKEFVGKNVPWAEPALKFFDASTSFLKKGTLYLWPSYWFNQAFGNNLMDLARGGIEAAGPGAIADFANLVSGGVIKDKFGNVITNKMFQEALKRYGVAFNHLDFADLANLADDTNISKYLGKSRSVSSQLKAGEKMAAFKNAQQILADKFENYYRARRTLYYMKEGTPAVDAARIAMRDLVNYRNLSPIESSVFRRLFFFYGWTKGATAQTVSNLFLNPGALNTQLRAARATAEFFSEQDAPPSVDEQDQKMLESLLANEQIAFPIGKDKAGKDRVARFNNLPLNTIFSQFALSVPRNASFTEIFNSLSDDTTRNIQKAAASSNPWIKVVAEKMSGKNLYFDRPLDSEFLRKLPSAVSIAEKIAPFPAAKIPAELVDEFWGKFLGAVPDGKGNLIAEPAKYYALTSLFPPIGRAISLGRAISDSDLSLGVGGLKALTSVGLSHQDLDNSMLYRKRDDLIKLLNQPQYKDRLDRLRKERKGEVFPE